MLIVCEHLLSCNPRWATATSKRPAPPQPLLIIAALPLLMNKNSSEQGRLVWTGCRFAALPEKCNSNDSAQTAKLVVSLDWVKRFHNTIIFGTYHTILAQRILGIQQNQCLAVFQRRRLCDDVFNTLADEFWRFRGCLRHSPKGKKPNNWLQETWWYIRLSQSVFVILTMNF